MERVTTLVAALGLLALGSWLGFVLHVRHPEFHAGGSGAGVKTPPARKRVSTADGDDLDQVDALHYAVHDPLAITPTDWTAAGQFVRPPPTALDAFADGEYPRTVPLPEVLRRWNPDNVTIPTPFVETLQVFNYSDPVERAMAEDYRDAELPFKVYDVPTIEAVRRKWSDAYLVDAMDAPRTRSRFGGGDSGGETSPPHRAKVQFKVEQSDNNHFMYWQHKSGVSSLYREWSPPTRIVTGVTFKTWLEWARAADADEQDAETTHHYLMLGTPPLSALNRGRRRASKTAESGAENRLRARAKAPAFDHFVSADLDIFTPETENFFVTDTAANKGIQCRFGMRGVIAEAHYDGGRNMVAMLKGAKRYVLTPPSSCHRLTIIRDRRHPSFRHSTTDWSHQTDAEANLDKAHAIDTVVREGEILYIPSYWIHYIVSLKYSIQCNTRSGSPPNHEGEEEVKLCVGEENTRKNPEVRGGAGAAKRPRRRKKGKTNPPGDGAPGD